MMTYNTHGPVEGISHPLIIDMYLKKEYGRGNQNILVIKTRKEDPDDDHETFASYLTDLLLDLEDLKNKAEQKIGALDRIDIRTA